MALGVSFKLAPGVRVRASTRGVRTSIGPRGARVHVGAGRTRISTGAGPFTVSAPLGSGSRRSNARTTSYSGPRQPTVAQLQAQARAAERAQQIADLGAIERALTTLHLTAFPNSTLQVAPVPPGPTSATIEAVRRQLYRAASAGMPVWKRAPRKEAKAWAARNAPAEAQRRHTGEQVVSQFEQSRFDEHWEALSHHDPLSVIEVVDHAFADNASDSTCVDAGTDLDTGDRYVTAVVSYGGIDLVPEHRPALTPGGKPTVRKRTKTERNALYATALASTALATAKEALAVAVAATHVRVLVIRAGAVGAAEPVYAGTFHRDRLAHLDWRTADPLATAMGADNAEMARKGSTREVVGLTVEPDSPAQALLDAFTRVGTNDAD